MRVNYATNNIRSEEHTGANVPLFANAEGNQVLTTFMRQRKFILQYNMGYHHDLKNDRRKRVSKICLGTIAPGPAEHRSRGA